jgi:hypothetical protein
MFAVNERVDEAIRAIEAVKAEPFGDRRVRLFTRALRAVFRPELSLGPDGRDLLRVLRLKHRDHFVHRDLSASGLRVPNRADDAPSSRPRVSAATRWRCGWSSQARELSLVSTSAPNWTALPLGADERSRVTGFTSGSPPLALAPLKNTLVAAGGSVTPLRVLDPLVGSFASEQCLSRHAWHRQPR